MSTNSDYVLVSINDKTVLCDLRILNEEIKRMSQYGWQYFYWRGIPNSYRGVYDDFSGQENFHIRKHILEYFGLPDDFSELSKLYPNHKIYYINGNIMIKEYCYISLRILLWNLLTFVIILTLPFLGLIWFAIFYAMFNKNKHKN